MNNRSHGSYQLSAGPIPATRRPAVRLPKSAVGRFRLGRRAPAVQHDGFACGWSGSKRRRPGRAPFEGRCAAASGRRNRGSELLIGRLQSLTMMKQSNGSYELSASPNPATRRPEVRARLRARQVELGSSRARQTVRLPKSAVGRFRLGRRASALQPDGFTCGWSGSKRRCPGRASFEGRCAAASGRRSRGSEG
jgi:hypothetical protein